MLKKIGEPAPPKGLKLKLFRAPRYFYHLKLGFLFGERFIHLKHWGRKSGQLKETVIEVIDQDKTNGVLYSASGFGTQSQWFKNISVNNAVFVTLRNTEFEASASVLSADEATEVLLRYVKVHPNSIKSVARLSGYEMDGSEKDIIAFSQIIKIVKFTLHERINSLQHYLPRDHQS
ncbi:MAG: nitroreductase family deazaflavin-dependent oxidoreductase [Gammaproteobacteria bacterium]|jgi:deazaflavin-dependent oxidoreductase (nitroreductase family)|nr:nitroreductase family deazaflavin-dependent oxidoreductase [Gammaproteobacteria bacterium]